MSSGNSLHYGDNLWVLREHVADESVDLIYLDPPFNSNAQYNVLFKTPEGEASGAQAEAFQDAWRWNEQSAASFDEIMTAGGPAAQLIGALRSILGTSDMMAYLTMMAARLTELHRVLKPTGTIFVHCDPTASHYLKLVMDGIFSFNNFRNEISWRRSNPKSLGSRNFPNCRDVLFRYTKSDDFTFHQPFGQHDPEYVEKAYKNEDERGRYQLLPLLNPNDDRPNLTYEFLGITRVWRWTRQRMQAAYESGLVVQARPGAVPRYKKYLSDSKGRTITNDWDDVSPIGKGEEIGYPTQKPLALLERVISSCSDEGDVVLDPFCGCGTTVHAAQLLDRRWIGIDVAHYAIGVIEDRLREQFGDSVQFQVSGRPTEIEGARELARRDKYQFQWWANWLVGVQNYREHRKGADSGIDGIVYFRNGPMGTGRVIVSVKGGDNVNPDMLRALAGTVDREKAELGLFVCIAQPSANMRKESAALGLCTTAHGKYPKVQIATIEDLLEGKQPKLPPRYEVTDEELALRKGRKKIGDPQIDFTFSIRGDKAGKTYPAERYVGRAWARTNRQELATPKEAASASGRHAS